MTINEIIIFSKIFASVSGDRAVTDTEKKMATDVLNDNKSTVKDMYDLACAFMNAGEVNFIEGKIANRSRYQNVSGVVNLAFACELFLKLLLTGVQYDSKNHKLNELWKVLDSNHHDIADTIKNDVSNKLSSDMTFEKMLEDDSNVFYNFRYFYETETMKKIHNHPLRPQFLRCFCFSLNRICNQLIREIEGSNKDGGTTP